MARSRKKVRLSQYFREPRGARQAVSRHERGDGRKRAIPPSDYHDEDFEPHHRLPWKAAARLAERGCGLRRIEARLVLRWGLDHRCARRIACHVLAWKALREKRAKG